MKIRTNTLIGRPNAYATLFVSETWWEMAS